MIYHKEPGEWRRGTRSLAAIGDLRRDVSAGRRPLGHAGARPGCGTAGEGGHGDPTAGMGRTDAGYEARDRIAS